MWESEHHRCIVLSVWRGANGGLGMKGFGVAAVGELACLCVRARDQITSTRRPAWHAATLRQGLRGLKTPVLSCSWTAAFACSTPWLAAFSAHAYDNLVLFHMDQLVLNCLQVAACICLFSLDKQEAIPVDTHVWQLAKQHYMPHLKGQLFLRMTVLGKEGEREGWAGM